MARNDDIKVRPAFNVIEAKVMLRVLTTCYIDPEDYEAAVIRERVKDTLIKFLAVNGGLILGGGSGTDLDHLANTISKPIEVRINSGKEKPELTDEESARIMAEIEERFGK